MAALDDPASKGMIFDARGPEALDLAGYGYRRAELWTCPGTIMNTILMQHVIPIGQKYFRGNTLETLERSQLSDTSEGYPGLETLGVKLHTVEQRMPEDLKVYTELLHHQYRHKQDKPPIRPLRPLSRAEEREYRKEIASGTAALRGIIGKNPIQAALR